MAPLRAGGTRSGGHMSASASTPVEVEGAHPVRSVFRLLGRYRRRVIPSVLIFPIKDSPQWLMPVVTASVIDLVVAGGPVEELAFWAAVAFVALAQNFPMHVLWTRLFMGAVRHSGADLRNALAARLQTLSLGFHTRVSA